MSQTQFGTSLLREQFKSAHELLMGTLQGVTSDLAHWAPQESKLNPIGAQLVHIITAEDMFVNAVLKGGAPMMASSHAGKSGFNAPPPMGYWGDWARQVKVDLNQLHEYAQAVFAATDAFLAAAHDADLAKPVDLTKMGLGMFTIGSLLSGAILNCHVHTGEVSAIKGLKGEKGYPV